MSINTFKRPKSPTLINWTSSFSVLRVVGIFFVCIQRESCICAHAWIFFKLCMIMTRYIQTTKMYVLNLIVKNKA